MTWREAVAARPRHVLLWALVAGLLAGPWAAPGALVLRLVRPVLVPAAALAVLAGAWLADARVAALERHSLAIDSTVETRATLLEAPRSDGRGGVRAVAGLPGGRVLLRADALPERRVGRVLLVSGRLRPPDRGALAARAHATLRVAQARATGARRGGLPGFVDGVRDRAAAALGRGLPAADGALLQGMVLGQDAALPEALRDDLRASGLAHLVAASGQNVLLLAALALAAGAVLGVPARPRLVMVLLLIALYVPLAGAGPSIQRAGVMGAAGLAATLAGRPAARWYAVGLAAAVTLLLDPRAAGDPGWQMSFAAVAGLALLARPLASWLAARRVPRGVAEAAAVALVATVATAPVAAAHFDRTAVLSVLANLLAAPAVAPVMWLGLGAGAVAQAAPALAMPLVTLAAPLAAYLRTVGTTVAGLPGAEAEPPLLLLTVTCAAALAALGAVAHRHTRERRHREALADAARGGVGPVPPPPAPRLPPAARRAVVALPAAALIAAWLIALRPPPVPPPPAPGVLRLTFLDVGQGDATLVQGGGAAVLVDAGPAGAPVARLVRRAGVRRLDALVLSHQAADHVGGAPALLREIPAAAVLDGAAASAGHVVRAGPLRLRVLWPPAEPAPPGTDPNDGAVVLEARLGASSALLPADAESPVLQALDLPDVDVLKVSHHGSADEGLPGLLARLTPTVAVISAGRRNGYGHPAPPTLAALRAVPRTLRTDHHGTVVAEIAGGRVRVGAAS